MHNPLIYVLIVAGVVTLFLGEYVDSSVIFGVVAVNAVVGFLQESQAESALDALRTMVHTEARVLRDGHRARSPPRSWSPATWSLVEAGDKVPADLRLIRETDLQVDESALTGESLPVAKDESSCRRAPRSRTGATWSTPARSSPPAPARDRGGDRGGTELGEIHRLVGAPTTLATPLTRKLAAFSALLTGVILALAAVTFAIGVARGEPAADMFTAAVALAVGAIPEGLPAAVTITLAIGVSRMARRGAIIRRLPAVETLGSATVICTDKTGTLTENRMTVRALWSAGASSRSRGGRRPDGREDRATVSPTEAALRWCLTAGANCNDAHAARDGR